MDKIESKEALQEGSAFGKSTVQKDGLSSQYCGIKYDLVGKIVEGTQLTRKTIVRILQGIREDVFAQFKINPEDYISTIYVDWVIFPPGEITAEAIYDSIPENSKKPSKEEFIDRYNTIKETNPVQFIKGEGNFKSYFGATYSNGITVFENTYWGNALYVIYEDWTEITKKSRSELLRLNPSERKFERIIHNKNWKEIFKRAIQ